MTEKENIKSYLIEIQNQINSKNKYEIKTLLNSIHSILNEYLSDFQIIES